MSRPVAVKAMIRIGNEESNCLSFVILIMPLITMLIKARKDFLGAKTWNLFLKRNCNNRRMKELCHQIMSTKLYTSLHYSIKVWVSSVHLVQSKNYGVKITPPILQPVLNLWCYFNARCCYSNTFGCYFNTLWCYVQTLRCNFNRGCGPLLTLTGVILTLNFTV